MKLNKKTLLTLFSLLLMAVTVKAASPTDELKYDIVSAGTGAQGTYLCKVTVYSKNGKVTEAEMKRAAVHGVIFKGVTGGNGQATQKPMATPTVEFEKADFFGKFFADNGPYMAYANVEPTTFERARLATKKEYRTTAIVVVSKDELRRFLEQAGVVRKLGDIF